MPRSSFPFDPPTAKTSCAATAACGAHFGCGRDGQLRSGKSSTSHGGNASSGSSWRWLGQNFGPSFGVASSSSSWRSLGRNFGPSSGSQLGAKDPAMACKFDPSEKPEVNHM